MGRTRLCGECGTENAVNAAECKKCGKEFGRTVASVRNTDAGTPPIPTICEHPGCPHKIGYSQSTRGGGPWYCWRHGPHARPFVPTAAPVKTLADVQREADVFCALKGLDTVAKMRVFYRRLLTAPPRPSKAWAHEILRMPNASALQIRFANEALANERSRVPGEDDEG